jgi:hypothetical protein
MSEHKGEVAAKPEAEWAHGEKEAQLRPPPLSSILEQRESEIMRRENLSTPLLREDVQDQPALFPQELLPQAHTTPRKLNHEISRVDTASTDQVSTEFVSAWTALTWKEKLSVFDLWQLTSMTGNVFGLICCLRTLVSGADIEVQVRNYFSFKYLLILHFVPVVTTHLAWFHRPSLLGRPGPVFRIQSAVLYPDE